MSTLLTAIGFVLFTALLIRTHLRQALPAHLDAVPGAGSGRACPRCGVRVPARASRCPACAVPLQVFDVVEAREVPDHGVSPAGERLHAIVRKDVCIGCGTCVAACPESGAIAIVNRQAQIDKDRCVGHGRCAEACPVNAIALSSGAAVQRVQVPSLDGDFQSNVQGLYIVGELGGRGLIKNAINEGKVAVESIARKLDAAGGERDPAVLDVVVVGAGPAGLSAGLEAHKRRLTYAVLERATAAETIRRYPRHKVLFAEPVSVPLYGDLWITDASKETLLEVWQTIITRTGLQVKSYHEVRDVRRQGDFLLVETNGEPLRARHVVLALGRRGAPRHLGVPGEELPKVFYDIVEVEEFRGARVLVAGGGDSAIESAVGLSNQPGTSVCLIHRGDSFHKANARNREKLDAAVASGRLRVITRGEVGEIRSTDVVLRHEGETITLPNDYVIVRIGGEAPAIFLDRVGVRVVQKELALTGAASGGVAGA